MTIAAIPIIATARIPTIVKPANRPLGLDDDAGSVLDAITGNAADRGALDMIATGMDKAGADDLGSVSFREAFEDIGTGVGMIDGTGLFVLGLVDGIVVVGCGRRDADSE
jgi:hypothetical protein